MANHASALKRARQARKIRARKRAQRSAMRTAIKRVRLAVDAGDVERAQQELKAAIRVIDSAGRKRLIHPRQASRRVSRLNASVRKLAVSG
ncbi:MAG: 30S ribosomal protein S20 [Zetaproteobacteria bacterium]|nr:MAG: 30S ribosomal protein S20 [Zetaproteobacteria bacterium]